MTEGKLLVNSKAGSQTLICWVLSAATENKEAYTEKISKISGGDLVKLERESNGLRTRVDES